MSKIGIVISKQSKMLRRLIIPDSGSDFSHHPLAPGEQLLIADNPGALLTPDVISSIVQRQTGTVPPSARCAVVVKANAVSGNVVNVIQADPAIDSVPGSTLMLHATAATGWTWSSALGLQPPAVAVG